MKKIVSFVLSFPLLFGFLLLMLVALIAGIVGGSQGDSSSGSDPSASGSFPEMVEVWRQNVLDCATEFEIPEYTDVLLAIMQGESGGEGLDIMQASEGEFNTRFPNVPNGITDPQYSIECGVQEFKKAAELAGVTSPDDEAHLKVAFQTYNFGMGYATWVKANYGGVYTLENATEFSEIQAASEWWKDYLISNGMRYPQPYGVPEYAEIIWEYYTSGRRYDSTQSVYGYVWPAPGCTTISSPFGYRDGVLHNGIDIAGQGGGTPVVAVAQGTVEVAGYNNDPGGYGNFIQINHGDGVITQYGHIDQILVSPGDTVEKGQKIAVIGKGIIGSSTGPHLHFRMTRNGQPADPMDFLPDPNQITNDEK